MFTPDLLTRTFDDRSADLRPRFIGLAAFVME
jgi:hypothetical protein